MVFVLLLMVFLVMGQPQLGMVAPPEPTLPPVSSARPTTSDSGNPGPGSTPGTGTEPTEFDRFRAACAAGLPVDWRHAQIDYPRVLEASVGQSVIYEAAIDAREARPPADRVITVGSGTADSKEVAVRCRLAAKLQTDDLLAVAPESDEWEYRDFSSTGVVQWAWTLTPKKPVDQKVTLLVRPAIDVSQAEGAPAGGYGVGGNTEVRVFTDVAVRGTVIERVSYWFETQWLLVVGIATIVGSAITLLIAWIKKTRREFRGAPGDGPQGGDAAGAQAGADDTPRP